MNAHKSINQHRTLKRKQNQTNMITQDTQRETKSNQHKRNKINIYSPQNITNWIISQPVIRRHTSIYLRSRTFSSSLSSLWYPVCQGSGSARRDKVAAPWNSDHPKKLRILMHMYVYDRTHMCYTIYLYGYALSWLLAHFDKTKRIIYMTKYI